MKMTLVSHGAGKGHLVRDDDHGHVLLGERADDLEHLARRARGRARRSARRKTGSRASSPARGRWPRAAAGRRRAGRDRRRPCRRGPSSRAVLRAARLDLARGRASARRWARRVTFLQHRVVREEVELLEHQPEAGCGSASSCGLVGVDGACRSSLVARRSRPS